MISVKHRFGSRRLPWYLAVVACSLVAGVTTPAHAYRLGARWTQTATDTSGISLGDPITLTWGFVPDGTSTSSGTSDLISFLDNNIGAGPGGSDLTQRPWFQWFDLSFDRWEQLTGNTYIYEPNDDGVRHNSSGNRGILGTRADVRIGGIFIDGPSNVLAFNSFPNNGDMTFDTGDGNFFSNPATGYRRLRNTTMHEHGHGLGLNHVESAGSRFLMEPILDTGIDGPQFDDILGAQRAYGDFYEKAHGGLGNDTAATAVDLGTVADGMTVALGLDARDTTVLLANTDFVSIDDDSDTDFFSFSIDGRSLVDIRVTPVGPTYNEGAQNGAQAPYVTSEFSNLSLALIGMDQSTLLAADNSGGLGQADRISDFTLADAGQYYVRINGDADQIQMYELAISVVAAGISGDFNQDGTFGCADVDALVQAIVAGNNDGAFDLTGDGLVNTNDLNQWLAEAGAANNPSGGAYLIGDANLDGSVDVSDFNIWNGNKFSDTPQWCAGDFNADGSIDVSDFNTWNSNKFQMSGGMSAVPEPAAHRLLLVVLVVGWLQRRHFVGSKAPSPVRAAVVVVTADGYDGREFHRDLQERIAMSDSTVRGKVHLVEPTKTYGQNGFRKRLVVLEQDKGRFTNYVPLEFTNDNCDTVDTLKVGDEIDVSYRLNGRRWQKDAKSEVKFFLNAEAIRFSVVGEKGTAESSAASAAAVNEELSDAGYDEDDVPF